MIDFHCHILPQFDDGSTSLEESLEMARVLVSMGFTSVIATPHLMDNYFEWKEDALKQKIAALNSACLQNEILLKIYAGAEIMLSPSVLALLSSGDLPSLNNSDYVLLEAPLSQPLPGFCEDVFFRLRTAGYQPVLAHPERCLAFQEEPEKLYYLRRYDVLYQINLASLTGHFGESARKIALLLLRQGLVSFVGSDSHHPDEERIVEIPAALDILRKYLNEENVDKLLYKNPRCVLDNEPVVMNITPIKSEKKSRRKPFFLKKLFGKVIERE